MGRKRRLLDQEVFETHTPHLKHWYMNGSGWGYCCHCEMLFRRKDGSFLLRCPECGWLVRHRPRSNTKSKKVRERFGLVKRIGGDDEDEDEEVNGDGDGNGKCGDGKDSFTRLDT